IQRPTDVERRPFFRSEILGYQASASRGEIGALKAVFARCRHVSVLQSAQNDARAVSVAPLERVGMSGREVYALWHQSIETGIEFETDLCPLSDRHLLRDHLAEVFTAVVNAQRHIGTYGDRH